MSQLTARPLVCLITEGKLSPSNFSAERSKVLTLIGEAALSNIPLVQIREKSLNAAQLFDLCSAAVEICDVSRTSIIVNDRLDVALACGAAGVHLPSNGLPVDAVRQRVPNDFLIGRSAHTINDVLSAKASGADYAFFSPVFDTPGKGAPVGIERLRECIAAARTFPVIALGGIAASNYQSVFAAGSAGFAAIRFLNDATALNAIGNEYFEPPYEQNNNSNR